MNRRFLESFEFYIIIYISHWHRNQKRTNSLAQNFCHKKKISNNRIRESVGYLQDCTQKCTQTKWWKWKILPHLILSYVWNCAKYENLRKIQRNIWWILYVKVWSNAIECENDENSHISNDFNVVPASKLGNRKIFRGSRSLHRLKRAQTKFIILLRRRNMNVVSCALFDA